MPSTEDAAITVSYSQIQSFDRCEKAWEWKSIDDWQPIEKKGSLEIGTVVHDLIAKHYSGYNWNQLQEELQKYLVQSTHPDRMQVIDTAGWLVRRYIEDYAPVADAGWRTIEAEKHFLIPLVSPNGVIYNLQGYIDRLKEKDGRIWVEETKTVGQGKFWTPTECMMDAQVPTYCAAMRELGYAVFGIHFNMLNTYVYKDRAKTPVEKLFRREKTYRTPVELDNILYQTGLIVERMVNHDGIYRRSMRRDCSYCFFNEPCLMEIKGIDPLPFLQERFTKRVRN